jgi:hypothetical protein
MARHPNGIDPLRTPVEIARNMFQEQLESFRVQATKGQPNPLRQVYEEQGIDIRKIRDLSV